MLSSRFAMLLVIALAVPAVAHSDIVRLPDGGAVRGQITNKTIAGSKTIEVESMVGTTYRLAVDEVVGVSRRPRMVELYESRDRVAAKSGDPEAHVKVAKWCRANRMLNRADEQFWKVVRLDPDHEYARRALGFTFDDGDWLSREQRRERAGLVQKGGKWVPEQAVVAIEERERQRTLSTEWFTKLRPAAAAINGFDRERRLAALNVVSRVTDPNAVRAIQTLFAKHPSPEVRAASIDGLESIGGVPSIKPLVLLAVKDIDARIREESAAALDPRHPVESVRELTAFLKSKSNAEVLHAAEGLEAVGHALAVPHLINALTTSHLITIEVPDNTPAFSVGGGQIGQATGSTLPPSIEAALRTGQLPAGVQLPKRRTIQRRVRRDLHNETVLSALVAMTGQNFGYDESAWSRWYQSQQKALIGK